MCHISGDTTVYVAGTYTGAPFGNLPPLGSVFWPSDLDGAVATSWELKLVDTNDGSFTLIANASY